MISAHNSYRYKNVIINLNYVGLLNLIVFQLLLMPAESLASPIILTASVHIESSETSSCTTLLASWSSTPVN